MYEQAPIHRPKASFPHVQWTLSCHFQIPDTNKNPTRWK
jgi:hypothetical protein